MKKGYDEIDLPNKMNFSELRSLLIDKESIYSELFNDKSVKFFLNLEEINNPIIEIKDGDEIAFLPPVTGG